MARLPKNNEVDIEMATERFADAEARDSLVRESEVPLSLSLSKLKRAARSGASLASLMSRGSNVIPLRAVQVYRALLSRSSIGMSQMARAASTTGDLRRSIDKFEMNVVEEDDAVFLMLSPVGDVVPETITLLNDDGRVLTLQLPAPVNATQQLGFAQGATQTDVLLSLLRDPATSIYVT